MGRYDGKASGGLCGAKAFEDCCAGFGGFKACPSLRQAEGCAVLRLSKAAAGLLEVLRLALR